MISPQCPVHKAILLVFNGGCFTGLGFTKAEAIEVARLKYQATT